VRGCTLTDNTYTIDKMREVATSGAKIIRDDESHRFYSDMDKILTDHIEGGLPEEERGALHPFEVWEDQIRNGGA
jgi:hypothetical protein